MDFKSAMRYLRPIEEEAPQAGYPPEDCRVAAANELLLMMRFPHRLPVAGPVQCFARFRIRQKIEAKVVDREVIQQRLGQISGKNRNARQRLCSNSSPRRTPPMLK